GEAAVFAPRLCPEHRPERAFATGPIEIRTRPIEGAAIGPPSVGVPPPVGLPAGGAPAPRTPAAEPPPDRAPRPTRLLPAPAPILFRPEIGSRPPEVVVRGQHLAVTHLDGPERLAGEWWERPYRRDYYLAR